MENKDKYFNCNTMYLFMLTNNQKRFGLANQALEKYLCMQCYEADKCRLHYSDVGKDNLKFLFIRAGTGTSDRLFEGRHIFRCLFRATGGSPNNS